MARASARGGRRPRPNARQRLAERQRLQSAAVTPEAPKKKVKKERSWEDQLLLGRMRRHMKWVFVLLAVFFALGFVVFGVGTGSGGGSLGDVLRDLFGKSKTNIPTLAEAQREVADHPNDPGALHDLAVAQRNARQYQAAAATLEKYVKLRPKDAAGLTLLAATYATEAATVQNEASALRSQGLGSGFTSNACQFAGTTGFLNAACENRADEAQNTAFEDRANQASERATAIYAKQADVYSRLVQLTPGSADAYKLWAAAAGRANKRQEQIRAYEQLLQRFPTDPDAARIRALLKQLKASNDVRVG